MNLLDDQQHLDAILEATRSAALQFLESLATRPAGRTPARLAHDVLPEEGIGALAAILAFRGKYEEWLSGSPGPRYFGFVTAPAGLQVQSRLPGRWCRPVAPHTRRLAPLPRPARLDDADGLFIETGKSG